MTSIPSSPITTNPTAADIQSAKLKCQSAQTGSFEALFAIFSSDQSSSSNCTNTASSGSTTQANGSISGIFDILLSENSAAPDSSGSNFSSDFDNAFGTSGPLFDFINTITSQLHLSAAQNQALQNISIEHKDDAGTGANVTQEVAAELTAAGIG